MPEFVEGARFKPRARLNKLTSAVCFNDGKPKYAGEPLPVYLKFSIKPFGDDFFRTPIFLLHGDIKNGVIHGEEERHAEARTCVGKYVLAAQQFFLAGLNRDRKPTPTEVCGFLRGYSDDTKSMMMTGLIKDYINVMVRTGGWNRLKNDKPCPSERQFNAIVIRYWEYMQKEYRATDYPIQNADVRMLTRFEIYLRELETRLKKPMAPKTIEQYIFQFLAMFDFAVSQGYLKIYPFEAYKTERLTVMAENNPEKLERKMSKPDLMRIEQTEISHPADMERFRLIFLIQRWCGMAWKDLHNIGDMRKVIMRSMVDDKDQEYIYYNRQKSGILASLPVFPELKELLIKVNYIIDPGSYKVYASGIGRVFRHFGVEIKGGSSKKKQTHVGRHLFGSEMLEMGFSMEAVSRMMGHSSVKITEKIYAKINTAKIDADYERIKKGTINAGNPAVAA